MWTHIQYIHFSTLWCPLCILRKWRCGQIVMKKYLCFSLPLSEWSQRRSATWWFRISMVNSWKHPQAWQVSVFHQHNCFTPASLGLYQSKESLESWTLMYVDVDFSLIHTKVRSGYSDTNSIWQLNFKGSLVFQDVLMLSVLPVVTPLWSKDTI